MWIFTTQYESNGANKQLFISPIVLITIFDLKGGEGLFFSKKD